MLSRSSSPAGCGRQNVARMRPFLGTLVEISAGGRESRVNDVMGAAFDAIERVQRLMSFHDAGSDVSRINAAPVGREVAVDRETYCVLRHALDLSERSDGAFDITVAPSLVAAGFLPYPRLSRPFQTAAPVTQVDSARFSDLDLLPA